METTLGISTTQASALRMREEIAAMGKLSRMWGVAYAMHQAACRDGDVVALAEACALMEAADRARVVLLEGMSVGAGVGVGVGGNK